MIHRLFLLLPLLALPAVSHAQDATGCPANAAAYKIVDTPDATIVHCHCTPGYSAAGGECVPPPPPPSVPRPACSVVEERIAADLEQIHHQRDLATENAAQFAEWNAMGKDGRKDFLKASVELAAGTYAADLEDVTKDMGALQAETAAANAGVSTLRFNPQRYADLQKLKQLTAQLDAVKINFGLMTLAKTGLDADESWELAQGAMHDGFAAAAGTNAQLASALEDPSVHEALLGPEDEDPFYEHVANVTKAALGELVDSGKLLEHYKSVTGPSVRVASFVIDGAYADLELWFAASGADTADQTAGQLARAAGIMQAKYRDDIQARQTCVP
jgi:hypothetical protein